MTADPGTWLFRPDPDPDAVRRVVCLPHAGGSASFFRGWAGRLPGTEVVAVRYPGRAERIDDSLPDDVVALSGEVAEAVAPLADRPLALFGHSMGAAVALETARALEAAGVEVAHLFASGSRDGELPPPEPFDDDPDAVLARLVELGGTDAELAADPVFAELILPYVLSDGRMFHGYAMAEEPRLRCAVTTIVGDADPDADQRPWRRLTAGSFREHVVPGDHFYLTAAPPFDVVHESLAATTARP